MNEIEVGGTKIFASIVHGLQEKERSVARSTPPLLAITLPLTLEDAGSLIPVAALVVHA